MTNRKSTNNNEAMTSKNTNSDSVAVFASITPEERDKAKYLAKSKGMTFQGWLGQLIKREINPPVQSEAVNG